MKMQLPFNLSELSQRRTQLMGIATLMIIACHASASNVLMPHWLSIVMDFGNLGVDIFLFLSGISIHYSLTKNPITTLRGGVSYCKRRCYRIFIPYWIVYIPYCIVLVILGKYAIGDCLMCLGALEYWFYHRGAWFVSLILLLYLFAPLIYRFLNKKHKWATVFSILFILTGLCQLPIEDKTSVLSNMQFAFSRAPSFLMGMALGNMCQENRQFSILWGLLLAIIGAVAMKLLPYDSCILWTTIPFILCSLLIILRWLEKLKWVNRVLVFMGKISLESYLTNITLNSLLSILIGVFFSAHIFYGKYLQYSIVIVVGIIAAYYINKLSRIIIDRLLQDNNVKSHLS